MALCSFPVPHCLASQMACCGMDRASAGLEGIFQSEVPLEKRAELGQVDGTFMGPGTALC